MKIIGIGTDIVSITRIESIWDRFGVTFARRILTPTELLELPKISKPVHFLAKRFAAKEAFAKALGTGFRQGGIWLTEIGVVNDSLGKPEFIFRGNAASEVALRGITESHLSLSDEKEFAVAFVILIG